MIQQEAARRKVSISVTIKDVWDLFVQQDRRCVFTGKLLSMSGKRDGQPSGDAALDLIDPGKGYVAGNIQWIDKRLQYIKKEMSDAEFIDLCEDVAAYQVLRQQLVTPPTFKEWTEVN